MDIGELEVERGYFMDNSKIQTHEDHFQRQCDIGDPAISYIPSDSLSCALGVAVSKLWPHNMDINDNDEECYRNALDKIQHDAKSLRTEIMYCTRLCLLRRFQVAHAFLENTHGIDYSAPEFQTRTQDNLLLAAIYFRAHAVVERIVERAGRGLILAPCGTSVFEGGTALHVAILQRCPKLVGQIMTNLNEKDRYQLLNTYGSGEFFKSPGNCHEVPILLAIQVGCTEVFLELVKFGADITAKHPTNGNGLLHCLVLFGKEDPQGALDIFQTVFNDSVTRQWYCKRFNLPCDCFSEVEEMQMASLLLKVENTAGYSPITFAALHGVYSLLQEIIQVKGVYKFIIWNMGAASNISLYDMTEIDPTVRAIENPGKPSVLELLLYERADDDIPVLASEPIQNLMHSKWHAWKYIFILWGVWHFLTIICFTSMALKEHTFYMNETNNVTNETGFRGMAMIYIPPIVDSATTLNTCSLSVTYMLGILIDICHSLKLFTKGRLLNPRAGYYFVPWAVVIKDDDFSLTLLLFSVFTFLSMLCNLCRLTIPPVITGIAVLLGWYFLLFFTRAFRHTSLFTVMTNRMLHLDVLRFSIIAIIYIIAFGSCLLILLGPQLPREFSSLPEAIRTMFFVMIGIENLGFLDTGLTSLLVNCVAVAFVITATILLLNLLIAAMGDTYTGMAVGKTGLWLKMQVKSVLSLDTIISFNYIRKRMVGKDISYNEVARKWYLTVDNVHIDHGLCTEHHVRAFQKKCISL